MIYVTTDRSGLTHTHAGSNPATALTEISVVTDNNSQRKGGDMNKHDIN